MTARDETDLAGLDKLASDVESGAVGSGSLSGVELSGSPSDSTRPLFEPEKPKRGRGRPKGSTSKTPPKAPRSVLDAPPAGPTVGEPTIPPEMLRAVISIPYDFAAGRWGEHWRLTPQEIEVMLPAHVELANQYVPDWLREHAALYTVLTCHALFIIGRVQISRRLAAQQAEEVESRNRYPRAVPKEPQAPPAPTAEPVPVGIFGQVFEIPHEGPPTGPNG